MCIYPGHICLHVNTHDYLYTTYLYMYMVHAPALSGSSEYVSVCIFMHLYIYKYVYVSTLNICIYKHMFIYAIPNMCLFVWLLACHFIGVILAFWYSKEYPLTCVPVKTCLHKSAPRVIDIQGG